jgi:signal transduction histidine kinase/ligand-binding sensor domain-containing protein
VLGVARGAPKLPVSSFRLVQRAPLPSSRRRPFLLFLGCAALRLAGAPAPADYFYHTWRIDNGLTDNSVNTVLQDPQGYLWLATLSGLARFDGRRFEEFPLPAALQESGQNIRALTQEDPATLAMLPASGGVVRFRAGQFTRHPADAAVRSRILVQLFAEADGALWLGDSTGEILRWQDGKLQVFGKSDGLDSSMVGFSIARDGQGRTWVAEGSFLGRFENGRLVRFPTPVGTALVIAPARDGGIWISAAEQLLKWEPGRLTILSAAPEWNSARDLVQRLFEDSQGVLWLATRRNGLFQFAAGHVRAVPTQQQIVDWVAEDSERGIWVASKGGGVTRLQRQRFVMVRPRADQADIASTAVFEDRSGAVWCANRDGGVFRYFDGAVQHVENPPGEPPLYANTVCPDAAGTIWVGAKSGLYRVTPGNSPALESVAPELKDIHLLYLSHQGDLWINVGRERLLRRHRGILEDLMVNPGPTHKPVEAIAETADGTLWVALGDELYAYTGGRMIRQKTYDGFPGEYISALYGDQAGALWIGTDRRLLRLKNDRLTSYTQANGLPNGRIRQILEDDRGMFWFGDLWGFFHVARAELEAVAAGTLSRMAAVTFGAEEGLTGQTPLYNCQPNTWRGNGNRLWFCTQDGVLGIDADAAPLRLPPPPVYIERALIDGRPASLSGLRLSTGQHRLAFYFSSPSFAAPEKVRLRYRLKDFDSGWIDAGSDQEADYAGLGAGRYTLEVAASDPNGIWHDGTGTTLNFTVIPMWWETWWVRLLAVAAFTSVVVWSVRFTSHRLLRRRLVKIEQEHALEKERARIARDLHDELGGSLTQIGLLADRLKRHAAKSEVEKGLGPLARHTRQLAGELESIIWTVNPRNNSLERFVLFARQFALRFFRDTGIACSVLGVEDIPAQPITPEVQHHLLTVTKEALHNVLKHSQAASVVVEFSLAPGTFATAVRDDGIGFDPGAPENNERNGLTNMRTRLREIGGTMEIQSAPATGTVISWRVPRAAAPPRAGS